MRQRILPIRRDYNRWVGNEMLEDYALRFTARKARRWSSLTVANTAFGGVSFLALELIGGVTTVHYGFANAAVALGLTCVLIFLTALPISFYATRGGVDIDLLTRGSGFGYVGSTITSLVYASFTFIFFAIEGAILAKILLACFGIPLWFGYIIATVLVVPVVANGIRFISQFHLWTLPLWLGLQILPFVFLARSGNGHALVMEWTRFGGLDGTPGVSLMAVGAAASVMFSVVAQIGEQVDYLRFLPPPTTSGMTSRARWWLALLFGGAGWIVFGGGKILAGSFLAWLVLHMGGTPADAVQPTVMYLLAFSNVTTYPMLALVLSACFVMVSQIKINITNAYAGSIAWSNFFSRLTHSHPGRVVWVLFNVTIALVLMEEGIHQTITFTLIAYSCIAASWIGALVADLTVNKPLGFSPVHTEFRRAYLYDINPVGVGSMTLGLITSALAYGGILGPLAQAFAPFLALLVAYVSAPLIAWATGGRYYLARRPISLKTNGTYSLKCVICEHKFEREDMALCPAYAGPICSLCCTLDARCHDSCKPQEARAGYQLSFISRRILSWLVPAGVDEGPYRSVLRYFSLFTLMGGGIGLVLLIIYDEVVRVAEERAQDVANVFWLAFLLLLCAAGIMTWFVVLALQSRRVSEDESRRQTRLLMNEIRAHRRTDIQLQRAKERAEAANLAKSRFIVGVSHEVRTPLNAIMGYAHLLEHNLISSERRLDGLRAIQRGAEHLTGLIEGLLDISKIEAGRIELYREELQLPDFLDQLVSMFRLQTEAKGIGFECTIPSDLPHLVYTDARRLRQILINLLSNAVKFTQHGSVRLTVLWQAEIAEFMIEDTGIGIPPDDLSRIFEPFQRGQGAAAAIPGIGLGLTITQLLVQIMGGELSVSSTPGLGSCFKVRLMLSQAPQTCQPAPVVEHISGYRGGRLTAMVVDDDPVHRDMLRDMLEPLGFLIYTATDAQDCLNFSNLLTVNLFLLDVSMPGMDGFTLARRLRAGGADKATILIVSASTHDLISRPATDDSYNALLSKPVHVPTLLELIGRTMTIEWTMHDLPVAERTTPELSSSQGGLEQTPSGFSTHAVIPLNAEQISELQRLGELGYIEGIRQTLARIEAEQPDTRDSIEPLRVMIAASRIDTFLHSLRNIAQ
ncbi:MAG: ATP-binding protein [Acetobacter papayae]